MKYEKIIRYFELPRKQKKKAKKILSIDKCHVVEYYYSVKKEYVKFKLNLKSINKD